MDNNQPFELREDEIPDAGTVVSLCHRNTDGGYRSIEWFKANGMWRCPRMRGGYAYRAHPGITAYDAAHGGLP